MPFNISTIFVRGQICGCLLITFSLRVHYASFYLFFGVVCLVAILPTGILLVEHATSPAYTSRSSEFTTSLLHNTVHMVFLSICSHFYYMHTVCIFSNSRDVLIVICCAFYWWQRLPRFYCKLNAFRRVTTRSIITHHSHHQAERFVGFAPNIVPPATFQPAFGWRCETLDSHLATRRVADVMWCLRCRSIAQLIGRCYLRP